MHRYRKKLNHSMRNQSKGFTLIELVIIMPIIVFITTGLSIFIMSAYYQMVANITEMNLRLESQTLLLAIEDELLFTTSYGQTIRSDLSDPYQPAGGWTHNTNPETMIIHETSLDAPRRNPDREFIYKADYNCNSNNAQFNPIAIDNVLYFAEPNADTGLYTFKRRILTPQYSTCGANYRGQTCPGENVGSGFCVKADNTLSQNLKDFQVDYYDETGAITTNPSEGERATLYLTLGQTVFGRDVEVTSQFSMKKIN